uniref:C2H2-type domain-containing protein n=1 Tax=Romanomermis culicivorax TaxID=13658 RepID=A0A915JJ92_ROMCU
MTSAQYVISLRTACLIYIFCNFGPPAIISILRVGLMRCNTCGLSCSTVTEQAAHNLRHGIHGSFCCPFCGSCFVTELSMQRHMIRHCCEEWVMCRECGMCYKNIRLLALHFQTQHGKIHGATDMTCLPCNMNISTPQYHILTSHMVMALRMPRALYLDVKVFRTSTLSTPRLFDHRLFKQVYVCRVCKFNFVTALAAQKHHVSSHNGFAVFWTVICSADVLLVDENTDCKCGHCSFGGQFKKLLPHLNAKHSVEQSVYFCGSCDDRFDNPHDLIYHTQFNHKIPRKSMLGGDVEPGSDRTNVSEGSTSAHLVRFPNFSPLYCLLCGTCVADSAFVNHVASHRLPWSASGAISLHICLICGICFVEMEAQILCAHALAHAVTCNTSTSDKFYEFPYVTCRCEIGNLKLDTEKSNSNTGGSTSNVASSNRELPSQDNTSDITVIASADSTSIFERTADCLEPPHCDICHSVLSWNGPKVLSHYLESHCSIEKNQDY